MRRSKNGNGYARRTWVSVVGARPQFVKLAPICRAIDAYNARNIGPRIEHHIVHTGQHYERELDELLFVQMEIPRPCRNLAAGSGSPGTQLARMLGRLEPVLVAERPEWVIVYGDTNSTLAGALIAARLNIPLVHVEAGCRSADMTMPEEQARTVADHLSRLLLAPSQSAVENLHREGIACAGDPLRRRAAVVGDVMYDALLQNVKIAERFAEDNLSMLNLKSGAYYLLTIHRAENTNNIERLLGILQAAGSLDLPVLFPVHPRTRNVLESAGVTLNGRLCAVPPLGYLEMLVMERHARKILTDSGGVQKEAFYLGIPCVTLRERTEWPETVELGANCIAGREPVSIRAIAQGDHPASWQSAKPYGDGRAAEKIVAEIVAASECRYVTAAASV
jgi:UDP-N-acetylglucosamine 2-epimerase